MPIDPNKILLRDPQDAIPDVYRSAMARDKTRRRVKVRAAVLAWRFDPVAVRRGFDLFERRVGA